MEEKVWLKINIIMLILLFIMVGLLGSIMGTLNSIYIELRYKVEYQNSILHELEKEFRFFKCYIFDKKYRERIIINE